MPKPELYEGTTSDCQLDDVEINDKYHGSVITMVDEDIVDGPEKYHIKRVVSLEDGAKIIEEYWKEKKPIRKKSKRTRK